LNSKAKHLHWPIPDPASVSEEDKPRAFEKARDQIRQKIEEFKKTI
jgi:protein-tyrosine-phosphatase